MSVPSDVRFLSAEEWRSVFDASPTPTWLAGDDGRVVHANAALAARLDRPVGSLGAAFLLDDVHPDDREGARTRWEAARRERRPFELTCRLNARGEARWTRLDFRPLEGGRWWMGTLADVHDAVTARAAADRAARRTRLLAHAVVTVNAAATLEERLDLVTSAAADIVGAHQAVTSLTVSDDWSQAITSVTLSEKYAAWRAYATPPDGSGIYALVCRLNRPLRLTQAELEAHPAWRAFGEHAAHHPPMRGWLAVPLRARDGRNLGLIQLSDKVSGDFDEDDEAAIVQLAEVTSVVIENAALLDAERRARNERDEAARLLDTLFEASPVGVAFLDRALRYVRINTALADTNGLPAEAHLGRTPMELLPNLDAATFAALRRVVDVGEALRGVPVEGETPASPGVRRFWRADFYPVCGEDGAVLGVGIMAVEVTQQVRVQAALEESEARFRRLVDASPIGMVLGLPDGRITLANDAYLRTVGYTREEFERGLVDWARLTPPEYLPLDAHALREVEERGRSASYEKYYERRDGTRVPVQCTVTAFEGSAGQVAGYVVDLTALKEAERALLDLNATLERRVEERTQRALQLQEQLATVARSLPIILYALDEHGRFTLSEGRGLTDLGFTPGEAVGRSVFELYTGDDAILSDVRRALAGEEVRSQQTVAGQVFDVTYAPKLDANGRPAGFLGVSINVTDRARAERSLADRNEELRRSNEELERFAYVASHDLQAPIRAVTSFAELVARRYEDALDERGRAYLAQIVESGQHMKRLVDDLLAFSRLHTEQRPFEAVAANDVFDRVARRFEQDVEARGVRVTRGDLPVVRADAPQLDSLLQNLVSNGLKYARPDVTPHVHVSATRDGPAWHFRVRDNGIGIDEKYFERIFVIFQRLHGREQFEGTGIGLAVCKKIVERHGGRLWVESDVGVGSTFHFTLPA